MGRLLTVKRVPEWDQCLPVVVEGTGTPVAEMGPAVIFRVFLSKIGVGLNIQVHNLHDSFLTMTMALP